VVAFAAGAAARQLEVAEVTVAEQAVVVVGERSA
jgi:hypothetical protein